MLDQHPTIQSSIQEWMDSTGIRQYWDRLSLDRRTWHYVTTPSQYTTHSLPTPTQGLQSIFLICMFLVRVMKPLYFGQTHRDMERKKLPIGRPCAWKRTLDPLNMIQWSYHINPISKLATAFLVYFEFRCQKYVKYYVLCIICIINTT